MELTIHGWEFHLFVTHVLDVYFNVAVLAALAAVVLVLRVRKVVRDRLSARKAAKAAKAAHESLISVEDNIFTW